MKQLLTMTALAAMLATACTKEEGTDVSGTRSIVIDPTVLEMSKTTASVDTRATDVDFETGDAIGLTITMADGSKHADNARFSFGNGKFTSDDNLIWYEDIGLKSNLVAYHPYAAAVPTEFTVKADQSGANYTLSDLMIAAKQDVTPTIDATNMTFYHQLTKLVINVNNQSGGQIAGVSIQGTVPTATVDVPSKTVAVKAGVAAADIKACEKTANARYYAIVVPQTVAPKLAVTVSVGGQQKVLTQTYKQIDLKPGQYTVAIQVMADRIDVTLTGAIEDWTDNGSLVPDDGEPAFEEFDDYFMYDGERYALTTMKDGRKWMAENLRYVPRGMTVSSVPDDGNGIWYPCDLQKAAAPSLVPTYGLLYSYPKLLGMNGTFTKENYDGYEGVQGLCPKGWHVPTQAEWIALAGVEAYADGKTAGAASITKLNEDRLNIGGCAYINASSSVASPAYMANKSAADATAYGMAYYASSTSSKIIYNTADDPASGIKNVQYYAAMVTYNATNHNLKATTFQGAYGAAPVRCIKDAAPVN